MHGEPWFPHAYIGAELPLAPQRSKWYQEMDYEPLAVWAQVQVPALFVYGEADKWVPVAESIRRYRATPRHSRDVSFRQIPGADTSWLRLPPLPRRTERWSSPTAAFCALGSASG